MSLVIFPHLTFSQCLHLATLQTQLDDAHTLIVAAIRNQDIKAVKDGFVARRAIVNEQLTLVCGHRLKLR